MENAQSFQTIPEAIGNLNTLIEFIGGLSIGYTILASLILFPVIYGAWFGITKMVGFSDDMKKKIFFAVLAAYILSLVLIKYEATKMYEVSTHAKDIAVIMEEDDLTEVYVEDLKQANPALSEKSIEKITENFPKEFEVTEKGGKKVVQLKDEKAKKLIDKNKRVTNKIKAFAEKEHVNEISKDKLFELVPETVDTTYLRYIIEKPNSKLQMKKGADSYIIKNIEPSS